MVNKLRGVLVAVLSLVAGSSMQAGRDANVINACTAGGMTATMHGCNATINITTGSSTTNTGQRTRGDIVAINLMNVPVQRLENQGSIQVPNIGSMDRYKFGNVELVFATFSLANRSLNPAGMTAALKIMISRAARMYPWAQSMVWVGQVLPGNLSGGYRRVVELSQTYIDQNNLTDAAGLNYVAVNSNTLRVTTPASKRGPSETITVRFKPLNQIRTN